MSPRPQKQPSAIYKDEVRRRSRGLSSLLWMLVGALVVVMLSVFLYFSPLFDGFRRSTAELEAPVEPIKTTSPAMEFEFYEVLPEQKFQSIPEGVSIQEREVVSLPPPSTDLIMHSTANNSAPSQVEPAPINTAEADEPTNRLTMSESERGISQAQASQGSYILQIKSYEQAHEADLKRAEVLMAGVDAIVVRRELNDGSYLYQVISTPMSQSEATAASIRLRNNGIDSIIIEQRTR